MNATSYTMYTDAERAATTLALENARYIDYPLSVFERRARFARECSTANRVRDTVDEEMKKTRVTWAKERHERATLIRFWTARHTAILTAKGTAGIEQKAFIKWLKQIDKLIPTQKARNECGAWMKEPQYKTVTLDLIGGKLSATFYSAERGEWGWTTATARLDCPMSEGTFTATVPFDTLRELVATLDDGGIILRKERDISPLVIEQGRSKSRIKHQEIGDKFEWMLSPAR